MANFVVTTLNDELDSSSPTATLAQFGGANDLSLREALALANQNPNADTITFATSLSGGTLFLTQGELTITSSLTLDGDSNNDGTADITISADSAAGADDATTRVFHIGQYGADAVAATLDGLVIRDGIASFGGGIYLEGAHALTLVHSSVLDNTASRGGGIFGYRGATITLDHSAVSGNVASGGGGIAGGDATRITLTASTVSDNRARNGAGGGIAVDADATITLTDSTLSGNRAISDGGGIFGHFRTAITLTNATVVGNAAAEAGGGIYGVGQNHIALTNATVTGNSAGDTGGGIDNWGADGITTLTNSIVAGNTATGSGGDLYGGNSSSPSNLVFAGGNILGSAPVSFATTTGAPTATIDGSSRAGLETVFANVSLIDLDGTGGNPAFYAGVAGNNGGPVATVALRAADTNLALDGGDDTLAAQNDARGLGRVDVAGIAHNGANASDIGAFELQVPFEAPSLVVTTLTDVVDPFDNLTSLREALAFANGDADADSITFAAGLASGTLFLAAGELTITSSLAIDGDIDHDGIADITISADSAAGADDATSRVFSVSDGAASTIAVTLHGLTIRDGFALDGGAIAVGVGDQLTLSNTTVSDNTASDSGGAIWTDTWSNLLLDGSTVSGNHASQDGGGVYIGGRATIGVSNSTLANNSAGDAGGGIYGYSFNTVNLVNATVTGNSAGGDGGGLYTWGKGFTSIANSIIAGNDAGSAGDDLYNELSDEDLVFAGGNIIGSTPVNFTPTGDTPVTIDGASQAALQTVFASVALVDPDGAGGNAAFHAGVLGDNGGPVATVALRPAVTNPALDGGTDSLAPFTDARGLGRVDVAGVAHNGANRSDIGAFELQGPFEAASFVVTTLADVVDPFDGLTSLREALAHANQGPDSNTITFAANLSSGTLYLADGELAITAAVTIDGDTDHDGTADITISADSAAGADDATSRVFSISDGANSSSIFVALRGLEIRDGRAEDGGAIAVGVTDQLYLHNTTVSDSTASRNGGAIFVDFHGSVTLDASMVWNNRAADYGGGVFAAESATVQVINSTVAGNVAGDAGGGIFGLAANPIALLNATVTGNSGGNYGGGVASVNSAEVGGESVTIANSIVAGNHAHVGNDLYNALPGGALHLAGGNIIGSAPVNFAQTGTAAVTIDGASRAALETVFADVAMVDPDGAGGSLGFWAGIPGDHGGPVATVPLRSAINNPALDGGSELFATGYDARGLGRVDVPNASHNGANVSDIGAFELQGPFEPASFVVTTLDDVLDLSDGLTSLREALALANQDPDGNTITFAENLSGGTLFLTQGELAITSAVTIDGDIDDDGTADITISADSAPGADDATSRVFSVDDRAGTTISAGLRGLNIRDGIAVDGGAILLGVGDQLTLTNTTVSDNTASRSGGGIWTGSYSQLSLDRSTVSDNHAVRDGGGIYVRHSAAIGVFNSTIANNSARDDGGGIYGWSYDTMTLVNATVTGNSAGRDGGGLYNWKGFTSITNSIIAGNAAGGVGDDFFDVSANDFVFAGGNIIGSEPVGAAPHGAQAVRIDGTSRAALQTVFADVALVDPDGAGGNPAFYAGALDDNGGPVETVAIRTNGLAHDAGGNAALPLDTQDFDHDGNTTEPLPFDARDLARVVNRVVDVGAFEIQNSDPTAIFNHGLAVNEGASGTIGQAALFFIDAEESGITYTVTSLPSGGTLFLAGTPLGVNETFTQQDINHGRLSYTHDGGEASTDSFGFEVSDGVGGRVTGRTFDFTINPVNDDPIQGANTGLTLDEGDSATVLGTQLDFDDAEQGDSDIIYTVTAATANGTLFLNGTPLGLNGTFTQDDIANNRLTYTHHGSETTADSFGFDVSDGAGGTVTGQTFDFTINPVNDDPIQGANTGLTLDEGDSATVLGTQLDFDDAEQADTAITYAITAATANGTLFLSGTPLGVGGTFTQDDINTNRVTYTHDGSETTADSFGFDASDGVGGTVVGQTFQISVSGVNDAPGGNLAGGTILYVEDQAPTALDPSLTVTDPDDTHLEGARVAITGNLAAGQDVLAFTPQFGITGSFDAAAGVLTLSGHALLADYEAALRSVTYANTSQNPAEAPRTVSFQVDDGGGLVSLGNVGVNVVAVLDPPNDINGDHTSDIVWRNDAGTVTVWEMDGAHVLSDQAIATLPAYWHIVDADGDFNGDGRSDILWRDDTGVLVLWTMDGPNILGNARLTGTPDFGAIADYWQIADTGDLTGDGRADILWRDDAGRVVLWEMNGPAMVSNRLVADVATTSHIEDTADFTGDGRADILWRDDDGTLRIWEMNGANVVSDTTIGTVADARHLAGTGDFNGDERFDLLWRDGDGAVTLWEMDGANILAETVLGTLPAYWQIADIGDYNGDLASDLLWRDDAGTIVLWEMNGPATVENSAVSTLSTSWHIVA